MVRTFALATCIVVYGITACIALSPFIPAQYLGARTGITPAYLTVLVGLDFVPFHILALTLVITVIAFLTGRRAKM